MDDKLISLSSLKSSRYLSGIGCQADYEKLKINLKQMTDYFTIIKTWIVG